MTPRALTVAMFSVSDLLEIARLTLLGALLVALDRACTVIEKKLA